MAKKRKLQQKIQQSDSPLLKSLRDAGSQDEARSILYEAVKNAHKNFEVNKQIISDRESFIKEKQRENFEHLKHSQSPRQTDLFRQQALNKFNQFREASSPAQRDQYVKSQQTLDQADFRNQLRQTEIIRDPHQRVERLNQIIQGASNRGISSGNRFVVDAIKKRDQISESVQKQQRLQYLAEKDRGPLRELLSSEEYQNPQRRPGLTQAEQRKSMLTDLQTSTRSKDVLTEIRDELKKQTGLQAREKQEEKVKKAEERDAKAIQQERAGRFGSIVSAIGTVAGTGLAGFNLFNEIEKRKIDADRNAFGAVASVQARQQNIAKQALTDMSGQGLVRRYGDILFGTSNQDTRFLGESGYAAAQAEAKNLAERTREAEKKSAWAAATEGVKKIAGTTAAYAGVGATAGAGIGMVATPIGSAVGAKVGGIVGAVSGMIKSGSSVVSDLLDNRYVRETYGFSSMKQQAIAERIRDIQEQTEAFRDQATQRNMLRAEGVQGALDLRMSEVNLLRMGGNFVSSREALAQIGSKYMKPNQSLEEYQQSLFQMRKDIASGNAPGLEFVNRYAMGAEEYDLKTAQADFAMGVGSRGAGQQRSTTNRLLDLERSGRGSFEQLLGNVTSINRISGATDSDQKLRKIMSEAVSIGFDNAKLAQDFTQTVTTLAAQNRTGDTTVLAQDLGRMTTMLGGSQRALGAASDFYGRVDAMRQSNPLVDAMEGIEATRNMQEGQRAGMTPQQAETFAGVVSKMSTAQKRQLFKEIETGKFSEQNKFARSLLGGKANPELARAMQSGQLETLTGGKGAEFTELVMGINPKNMTREQIEDKILKSNVGLNIMALKRDNPEAPSDLLALAALFNPALAPQIKPGASPEEQARIKEQQKRMILLSNQKAGLMGLSASGEANFSRSLFDDFMNADRIKGGADQTIAMHTLKAGGTLGSGLGNRREMEILQNQDRRQNIDRLGNLITLTGATSFDELISKKKDPKNINPMLQDFNPMLYSEDEFKVAKAMVGKKTFENLAEEDLRRVDSMQQVGIQTVEIARTSIIELSRSIAIAQSYNTGQKGDLLSTSFGQEVLNKIKGLGQ